MNININLTSEQKESIKKTIFSEITKEELAKELFSNLSISGLTNEEDLISELYLYLKELRK